MSFESSNFCEDSEEDEQKATENVPSNYFSQLMDQACKIKSAQLSKVRQGYETSPPFIRATEVFASRNDNVCMQELDKYNTQYN